MNCLPCFGNKNSESNEQEDMPVAQTKGNPSSQAPANNTANASGPASQIDYQKQESTAATVPAAAAEAPAVATVDPGPTMASAAAETNEANYDVTNSSARSFGFRELAMATKNFRRESLLGESGFGKVYKGTLQGSGQVVAVKQLDKHGTKANKEFLAEVMALSLLHHPNLVDLIGYCADGDQRILVYEYMINGSLKDHLHELPSERKTLDWITRMKIGSGIAQAIEYLHNNANPQVVCRNIKSTNILLDEKFEPKLTDYGLMKFEIDSGNTMPQRIVRTVGCAPEYEQNGELTSKSDVYSFGIILLELITGRKPLDTTRPMDDQNLVTWAQPYFKDPKRYPEMADPQLQGVFPERSLNQAVGVAAMCVQEEPSVRPFISDVVAALSFLTMAPPKKTAPTIEKPHSSSSSLSSSSSAEQEQELEAAARRKEAVSSSDSEEISSGIKNKQAGYDEERDGSWSSESLYNEDDYDYDEDESSQEEMNYRSKRSNSIKRKATHQSENQNVDRNSSKGSHEGFKTRSSSSSSLSRKNVDRKSSRNY